MTKYLSDEIKCDCSHEMGWDLVDHKYENEKIGRVKYVFSSILEFDL